MKGNLLFSVLCLLVLAACGSSGTAAPSGSNNNNSASGGTTYTVTYNGNGATGGSVPVSINYKKGQTVTVPGNTGSLVKTGYTFAGWNTRADGSGTTYTQGQTFQMGQANVMLYAMWSLSGEYAYVTNLGSNNVSQYTIGADGSLAPMSTATVAAGTGPYSITVDPSGKYAYVVNYNVNNVSQYTIGADGSLTPMSPATVATGSVPSSVIIAR